MNKGREAILRWCQRNSYGYEGVEIDNFDTSFADGLAFCALLDSQRPDLLKDSGLEWDDLLRDFTRLERLEWAFGKADEIGIPRLLDPEDIDAERPDSKVVITYLSGMIKFFQDDSAVDEAAQVDKPTGSFAAAIDDLISSSKKDAKSPKSPSTTATTTEKKTVPKLNQEQPTTTTTKKEVPLEKQLENLEKMFQKGLLDQAAFEKGKQKIMEKMKEQQAQLSARSDHSSNSETSSTSSQSNDPNVDKTAKAIANLQKLYEKGTLSEEEYKKALEKLKAKQQGNAPPSTTNTTATATTATATATVSNGSGDSSLDTSKFSPDQLKQYEKLSKMHSSGLLNDADYQKALNNLLDKVNKGSSQTSTTTSPASTSSTSSPRTPNVSTPTATSTATSTFKSSVPLDKIQDTKKLNNLKTLLNKGIMTEEEFEKSVQRLYQQEQEKQNTTSSPTPQPSATSEFKTDIDIDSLKEEDLDEKTRGRLKAIERMYNAGLFKDNEYAHSRRKIIMQGLQENGGSFPKSSSTASTTTSSTATTSTSEKKPPVTSSTSTPSSTSTNPRKRTESVLIQQPNLPKEINADIEDYKLLYEKLLLEHKQLAEEFDELEEEYSGLQEQLSTLYEQSSTKKTEAPKEEVPEELMPIVKKIVLRKKAAMGKSFDVIVIYPNCDDSGNQVLMTEKVNIH
ncbi:hypothetical protein C9374_014529 [Naegleria lovaniensis]|uniref:Calponin-homology (CH) domain-containing protein n=1 Tax=Naegleria lovaniensis TaxID=51637 RepID=A0AA88H056_NAELO|nr:uncharacterized protein C9374_014529 [Naegleria lovaniensis]KAG2389129.1 hypothetical protein C9374_014529 [Naegleria lovaniensis]